MVPHVVVIGAKKTKVPKDLLVKSSELFFDFLKRQNIIDVKVPVEFTIVFVTPEEIRHYNNQYRNKDVPTDVLSFCTEDVKSVLITNQTANDTTLDLGDLILCQDIIEQNAMSFDVGFREELIRVTIHGILHLLGYDHSGTLGESTEEIFTIQESFIKELKKSGFIK